MAGLPYSQATADLIERQCRNVERKAFRLNKAKAAEAILKTYDLFGLSRPSKVVWCVDPFTDVYQNAAGLAGLAGLAGSAWLARSAGLAGSAWLARSAWSAGSAGLAGSARSAWSAGSAGSARSAWLAGSARSALDYDFDYYVFEFEYCQNPTDGAPNENDRIYLDYCELLMQAKEAGAGYRVELEDTLYIVPTPLVRIDEQNRFHSEDFPAIRWKGGKEFYYLKGENFEPNLWSNIVTKTITAGEVLQIADSDKREIAFSLLGPDEMLKGLKAKLIHTGIKGNKLYQCDDFRGTGETEYALVMKDASTPRQFIKFVPPEVGKRRDADFATAEGYKDAEGHSLPLEDYLLIEQEA